MSCRHRKAFPIGGGYILWCPDCGGWRKMRRVEENPPRISDGTTDKIHRVWWEPVWCRWLLPKGYQHAINFLEEVT